MRKGTVAAYIGMAILISLLTVMSTDSQEDIVVLEDSAFKDRQRPPAVFVHDEHNEKAEIEECSLCHHVYEGGKKLADESSEDEECSACHKLKGSGGSIPLMKAYHDLCKGCHREKEAGPVTCGECHPRKK